ncbi:MAG: hypothetical protein GY903_04800 [Fuerstiella sp.]|nr:hypothetical protein [Fuerstiella sp.]MCP4853794.1 hypothetical protein [Fuerstiella sp.]
MRRLIVAVFAGAMILAFTADSASAQCRHGSGCGFSYGGSGLSIGYSSYSPRSSFSIGYGSYPRHGYGSHRVSTYRTRGHYDYHPATIYRHGNHLHVQPAHYDYHRGRRGGIHHH